MLPDAFRGHGVFFYQPEEILQKYRNDTGRMPTTCAKRVCNMFGVRLHDHRMIPEPHAPTARLIATLQKNNVALAGWGFVRGEDPVEEATTAAKLTTDYGLAHYVADIEQDEHDSVWTLEKIPLFLQRLMTALPAGAGIAVSSYPYIVGKHPQLMRAAAPHADLFNPQIFGTIIRRPPCLHSALCHPIPVVPMANRAICTTPLYTPTFASIGGAQQSELNLSYQPAKLIGIQRISVNTTRKPSFHFF